jgi:transcriptional regulator with XRE-family HTH domain
MAKNLKEIVSDNIRQHRALAGLTQAELARKAKLTDVYISRIENGANNLTLDSIEQIAAALGISPLQLFDSTKELKLGKTNIKGLRQAIKALDAYLDYLEK